MKVFRGLDATFNSNAPQATTAPTIGLCGPIWAKYLHIKLPPAEKPTQYYFFNEFFVRNVKNLTMGAFGNWDCILETTSWKSSILE